MSPNFEIPSAFPTDHKTPLCLNRPGSCERVVSLAIEVVCGCGEHGKPMFALLTLLWNASGKDEVPIIEVWYFALCSEHIRLRAESADGNVQRPRDCPSSKLAFWPRPWLPRPCWCPPCPARGTFHPLTWGPGLLVDSTWPLFGRAEAHSGDSSAFCRSSNCQLRVLRDLSLANLARDWLTAGPTPTNIGSHDARCPIVTSPPLVPIPRAHFNQDRGSTDSSTAGPDCPSCEIISVHHPPTDSSHRDPESPRAREPDSCQHQRRVASACQHLDDHGEFV